MKSVAQLYNHIAYVVLYAPNRFPCEDYLSEDQQMNLERAFERLRHGVDVAYPADFHSEKRAPLNSLLDLALAAYRNGDTSEGARLLHEFENSIFLP
jgi:hypothetical protein